MRRLSLPTSLSVLALAAPAFAAPQESAVEAKASEEAQECTCTCEACLALHGPKAKPDRPAVVEVVAEPAEPLSQEERGYMGVTLGTSAAGVSLSSVVPGSPAEKAGLKAGDIVRSAEELPVGQMADLQEALSTLRPGAVVTLEVERGDEDLSFEFALGERAVLEARLSAPPAELVDVTEAIADPPPEAVAELIIGELEEIAAVDVPEEPAEEPLVELVEVPTEAEWIVLSEPRAEEAIVLPKEVPTVVWETPEEVDVEEIAELSFADSPEVIVTTPERDAPRVRGKRIDSDALPDGYIEIETRRERRPAASSERNAALRKRIARLEREVAELSKMIEELRTELRKRNPR